MKLNKKHIIYMITSFLVLGTIVFLGTNLVIDQENKTKIVNKKMNANNDNQTPSTIQNINYDSFASETSLKLVPFTGETLTKNDVINLGWDTKETITLSDWQTWAPNVTKIGLDDGVLSNSPFSLNLVLKSIEIPSKVTNIGYCAFFNSSLINIGFERDSKLVQIGESAFEQTNIATIDFPASLQIIGIGAFYGINSLATVNFASNSQLVNIAEDAFNSSGITAINVPNSVTTIGTNAFGNTNFLIGNQVSMLSTLRQNSSGSLYGFTQTQWDEIQWRPVQFSGTILTKNDVINIGWNRKTTIRLVDWENWAPNVTTIGDSTFNDGITNNLSQSPFANNSILKSIQIPPTIQNINYGSFAFATSLRTIEFSGTPRLQSIRRSAFEGSGITSINIPNSVTIIDEFAFNKTDSLSGNQISMLLTLRQNSSNPLYGFTQAQWDEIRWRPIQFTETILTMNDVINLGWDTKTKITLSDWQTSAPEVTKIGLVDEEINNSPFASNSILQSIEIPAKITTINYGAFYSTSSLKTISFEENSKLFKIGKSAFEGSGITELVIPESVKVIDDLAFKNTSKLTGDKISMPITLSKNSQTPLYGFSQEQWDLINWFSLTKDLTNYYIVVGSLSGVLILLLGMNALIIFKLRKINNDENNYDKSNGEKDNVEIWKDKYY